MSWNAEASTLKVKAVPVTATASSPARVEEAISDVLVRLQEPGKRTTIHQIQIVPGGASGFLVAFFYSQA